MDLFVREAKITDSVFITELSNQLGYTTTNENTRKRLLEILNNPDNCAFVVIDNENIIGWIHGFYTLRIESAPFIEIGGLVVDKNYRRKGIGKILVTKVIEWSHLKKCTAVRVRCNTLRKETHEFYNSIGFKEIKEQKIFDMQLK